MRFPSTTGVSSPDRFNFRNNLRGSSGHLMSMVSITFQLASGERTNER